MSGVRQISQGLEQSVIFWTRIEFRSKFNEIRVLEHQPLATEHSSREKVQALITSNDSPLGDEVHMLGVPERGLRVLVRSPGRRRELTPLLILCVTYDRHITR